MNCAIPDPKFSALLQTMLNDRIYVNNPHSMQWNRQGEITNISWYRLFRVSRRTFAEVTRTMQNYKVSTWTIHHRILWEKTRYFPSKSRSASV